MSDSIFHIFSDERFLDLTVYQYGYEKCDPLHSYGPFVRNHYLFHYIISGKGMLSVTEKDDNAVYHSCYSQPFGLFAQSLVVQGGGQSAQFC